MSKSYVQELLGVYSSVFKDLEYAYPSMRKDLSKDWSRLTRLIEQRGLPFLLVDLPALCKHLDRCMSENQYKLSGKPGSRRVSGRIVVPVLFRGLYLLIFEKNGSLKENIDVQALFFLRQVLLLAKKAQVRCGERAVKTTVEAFLSTDDCLPDPGPYWCTDEILAIEEQVYTGFCLDAYYLDKDSDPSCPVDNRKLLGTLDLVSGLLSSSLGTFHPLDWDFRHGPGVVSNLGSSESRYRFVSWNPRLETAFPVADCAFNGYATWAANSQSVDDNESCSKLIDVPKTFSKPRLIASEPYENMWCQQNMRQYMYRRVDQCWIRRYLRFNNQKRNQWLARIGSLDGSLATLDLSDASDRISCRCVGQFFRGNLTLLRGLRATRTRFLSIDQLGEKRIVELKKFSTMGNATTFPVQSLIFLGVALTGCCLAEGVQPTSAADLRRFAGRVSVFGDDIIVPIEAAQFVIRLLEVLDFKVNRAKTYLTGRFRESCGVECYAGTDVSPAYWHAPYDENPESYASVLETSNNFYQKWLLSTAEYLRSTIQRFRIPLVPMDSGVFGLRSFVRPTECHNSNKRRWNRDLQTYETLMPVLSTRRKRIPVDNDCSILQYFTEVRPHTGQPGSFPRQKWDSGVGLKPDLKLRTRYVDDGLLYASTTVKGVLSEKFLSAEEAVECVKRNRSH